MYDTKGEITCRHAAIRCWGCKFQDSTGDCHASVYSDWSTRFERGMPVSGILELSAYTAQPLLAPSQGSLHQNNSSDHRIERQTRPLPLL